MLRIKQLRRREKISQQMLADEIGVSRSTIAMWETGGSQPDNDSLEKLADYFCTSVDYLLGRTEDPINYDDPDLIAEIPLTYLEGCGGNVRKAYQVMRAVDEDAKQEQEQKENPASSAEDEVKVALFGGDGEVTDEMWEEVKKFADYVKNKYKR